MGPGSLQTSAIAQHIQAMQRSSDEKKTRDRVLRAKLQQLPIQVKGQLDEKVILRTIRAELNAIRVCYESSLWSRPDLQGRVTVRFVVAGTGKVTEVRIASLTMQDETAFAREALQAGVLGYILKEAASEELVKAVRMAAEGRTYLQPELGARLAAEPDAATPDDLSERELEVLRLIALGHTNNEIAEQLYLSVRTVESHRAHIQQKLGMTTRSELVRYAIERGLIDV
jgi:two-component system response regulator NreC